MDIQKYAEMVEPYYNKLTKSNARFYSQSGIRAAACISVMDSRNKINAAEAYGAMVVHNQEIILSVPSVNRFYQKTLKTNVGKKVYSTPDLVFVPACIALNSQLPQRYEKDHKAVYTYLLSILDRVIDLS